MGAYSGVEAYLSKWVLGVGAYSIIYGIQVMENRKVPHKNLNILYYILYFLWENPFNFSFSIIVHYTTLQNVMLINLLKVRRLFRLKINSPKEKKSHSKESKT